jgi:predicted RNase H-like nuclease
LVGVAELGYDLEQPRYKRPPKGMPAATWRPLRATACDELIRRVAALANSDPPLDLRSHLETRSLLDEPSPLDQRAYKRREDLLDAVICAWTAAFWRRHGYARCQVLGIPSGGAAADVALATIIAPARPEQMRP